MTKGGRQCPAQVAKAEPVWRAHGRLWARLPMYKRKVRHARGRIRKALTEYCADGGRLAVSFSYGKDSCVMLHLARAACPPHLVRAVYVDQGAEVPDTALFRKHPRFADVYGEVDTVRADITFEEGCDVFGWWGRQATGDVEFNPKRWNDAMFTHPLGRYYAQHGVTCALVGLRGEESGGRRWLLQAHAAFHRRTKPPRCYPLYDWLARDVWAYIATHDLPYNPCYDRECLGYDRYSIRVGPVLCAGYHQSHGAVTWLRQCYPEWFARMAERYPNWAKLAG